MAGRSLRLLSIDWDYFFPDPIGGPPVFLQVFRAAKLDPQATLLKTWRARIDMYLASGKHIPETSGQEAGFWKRFTFAPESSLFTAESHHFAADPKGRDNVSEIWNFDAHHDAGYEDAPDGKYDDGNWLMAYPRDVEKHVRYPSWKHWVFEEEPRTLTEVHRQFDDGKQIEGDFDRVFICRSGEWVPPWIDDTYREFVASCPMPATHSWPLMPRESVAALLRSAIARLRRGEPLPPFG